MPSPTRSSSLPGNSAGRAIVSLFGLAPSGVYRAAECYHRRGALLPHLFTLTTPALRQRSAVCFLWHFPSAHAAQALPGTLPYGARTFLRALLRRDSLTNSGAHSSRAQRRKFACSLMSHSAQTANDGAECLRLMTRRNHQTTAQGTATPARTQYHSPPRSALRRYR